MSRVKQYRLYLDTILIFISEWKNSIVILFVTVYIYLNSLNTLLIFSKYLSKRYGTY